LRVPPVFGQLGKEGMETRARAEGANDKAKRRINMDDAKRIVGRAGRQEELVDRSEYNS
jgi:hypothetical protein